MKNWTRYMTTNNTNYGIGLKGIKEPDKEVQKELKRRAKKNRPVQRKAVKDMKFSYNFPPKSV